MCILSLECWSASMTSKAKPNEPNELKLGDLQGNKNCIIKTIHIQHLDCKNKVI
jgi:hypothetical protein